MEECLWPRKRALLLVSLCINNTQRMGTELNHILSLSNLPSQFEFIVAGDISANSFINPLLDIKVTSDPWLCSVVQQSMQCMSVAQCWGCCSVQWNLLSLLSSLYCQHHQREHCGHRRRCEESISENWRLYSARCRASRSKGKFLSKWSTG